MKSSWLRNVPSGAFKDFRDPAYEEYDFDEAWDECCEQADRKREDKGEQ